MNRIRTGFLPLVFVLLVTLALAACTPAAPTPAAEPTSDVAVPPSPPTDAPTATVQAEPTASASTAVTLTDALGREVTFAEPPQRVVIAGRATQLLVDSAYLFPEAVDRVVAIEQRLQSTDFIAAVDPTAGEIEFLERDAGAEQIAPLNPDVVIMKTYMNETIGAGLEQIGIPVVYLELETPDQFARDVRILGEVFGNVERAEAIVAAYAERTNRITAATGALTEAERPSVLLLQHSETGGEVAFEVPPVEWLQTSMVEMAGGRPVWKDAALGGGWQVVTFDQIAAWNPEQIYVITYRENGQDVVARLAADPQWQALTAVQAGQLYPFATDYLSWDQPDSRWILGLEWLATRIQPELFSDLSIMDEARWFYTELYGLSADEYQQQVVPLLEQGLAEGE